MIYQFSCEKCGATRDEFRSVERRNDAPECCGTTMKRDITGYRVAPDLEPYYDDHLETYIKSKRHRRGVMKEKGVDEKFGKGWQ